MSAEAAVRKRGRPKKVISDPIEIEFPETKKSTTRAKSTKAAPKPVKTTPAVTKKPTVDPTMSKPAVAPPPAAKTPSKPSAPESKLHTPTPSKTTPKPPATPETSKILEKVRKLSSKSLPAAADPASSSKLSPTTISAKSAAEASSPKPPSPSATAAPASSKPIPAPISSQKPPGASKPPSKIPIAALNSEIVSSISSRAGARPNTGSSGKLPPNYKNTARKITYAIVAMPILIVTSYVLYERLVLGEDRKLLVKPGLTKVDAPGEDTKGGTGNVPQS